MPAYIVVQVDVLDPVTYARYKSLTPAAISAHGGRFLVRGGPVTTLEGTWHPGRFVIIEFPSAGDARAFWDAPGYAEAKSLRQASASTEMILVEGV